MNFNKSGWFEKYVSFRAVVPFQPGLPSAGVQLVEDAGVHNQTDQAIYQFLQPTGLLYGFPVGLPFPDEDYEDLRYLDQNGRVHLIFLEALFACLVADRHSLLDGLRTEPERFSPAVRAALSYFVPGVAPPNGDGPPGADSGARHHSLRNLVNRLRGGTPALAARRFEGQIRRRIQNQSRLFLFQNAYYNSFLFLDLFDCLTWQRLCLVEPENETENRALMAERRHDQQEALIRLMIAAANAEGGVNAIEKRLLDQFIRSCGLPRNRKAALKKDLYTELQVRDIQVPPLPWLVRRYFLELILMMIITGETPPEIGRVFMYEVVEALGLWDEELNQSQSALEVFLLNRADELPFLRGRPYFLSVGDRLRERAAVVIRRNLDAVVNEIRETHELYSLLMKSARQPLTADEKRKVREQLMDIMKTVPALAIFALPGGGVILPVLIKLLPFNLLPSSFEE